MTMIPLPFLIATTALFIVFYEWYFGNQNQRNFWFLSLLLVLAFQEVLIGARFGYGLDWLGDIQPVTAAMLPPLAYLSFRRPSAVTKSALHALPVLAVLLALFAFREIIDALLAINNLIYAIALLRLGLNGSDVLGWVEIGRTRLVTGLLWLVGGTLIVSGLTDIYIIYNYWAASGVSTGYIAGWASLIGLISIAVFILVIIGWNSRNKITDILDDTPAQKAVFAQLETLMSKERLFIDADINLNRVARRLVLPIRDVSRAINSQTGQNVSQYVNRLRVDEACRLLRETDLQVTAIAFESGFNTKSNFYREFTRITGKTPRLWRQKNE